MNISDLQYIESVDASEVQGAGKYTSKYFGKGKGKFKLTFAKADATADAAAFGDFSKVETVTESVAEAGVGSAASSKSSAVAASKKYYH